MLRSFRKISTLNSLFLALSISFVREIFALMVLDAVQVFVYFLVQTAWLFAIFLVPRDQQPLH